MVEKPRHIPRAPPKDDCKPVSPSKLLCRLALTPQLSIQSSKTSTRRTRGSSRMIKCHSHMPTSFPGNAWPFRAELTQTSVSTVSTKSTARLPPAGLCGDGKASKILKTTTDLTLPRVQSTVKHTGQRVSERVSFGSLHGNVSATMFKTESPLSYEQKIQEHGYKYCVASANYAAT